MIALILIRSRHGKSSMTSDNGRLKLVSLPYGSSKRLNLWKVGPVITALSALPSARHEAFPATVGYFPRSETRLSPNKKSGQTELVVLIRARPHAHNRCRSSTPPQMFTPSLVNYPTTPGLVREKNRSLFLLRAVTRVPLLLAKVKLNILRPLVTCLGPADPVKIMTLRLIN